MNQEHDIHACVHAALTRYFETLDGEKPVAVYNMVLRRVERPMLQVVMERAGGNQTLAAEILGINRNTRAKSSPSISSHTSKTRQSRRRANTNPAPVRRQILTNANHENPPSPHQPFRQTRRP